MPLPCMWLCAHLNVMPKVSKQLRASRRLARSFPSVCNSHDSFTMAAGRLETPRCSMVCTSYMLPESEPACTLRCEQVRSRLSSSHTVAAHHPCQPQLVTPSWCNQSKLWWALQNTQGLHANRLDQLHLVRLWIPRRVGPHRYLPFRWHHRSGRPATGNRTTNVSSWSLACWTS